MPRAAWPGLAALVALAACGPVTVEQAERDCLDRAQLAAGPRGMVAVGAGTGGTASKLKLSVSSDYLQGRDPAALYDACVVQKSGQMPRTPLYLRPDWKG